ncbi:MAG: GNAT family N-acetyltransferase [Vicinamibacterales bacterium]
MAIPSEIRLLGADDLDGALRLSSTAGWNQRIGDWRMLLRLAPAGSFAAISAGRIVGTAMGIDYGRFGWIAMMLVDPGYRGRGLGARLLEAAMNALPPSNPIRLDATPLGRSLYARYGFEDETVLTRHVAEALNRQTIPANEPNQDTTRAVTAEDLAAVVEQDVEVFGGRRRPVLEWALEHAPQYARAVQTDIGLGYCFGRRGRLFDQIGPIVAGSDEVARALVSAALRAGHTAVTVDAFDARGTFTAWLRTRGFSPQRPLFRMRRPADGRPSHAEGEDHGGPTEYAILGPEFA